MHTDQTRPRQPTWALGAEASHVASAHSLARVFFPAFRTMLAEASSIPGQKTCSQAHQPQAIPSACRCANHASDRKARAEDTESFQMGCRASIIGIYDSQVVIVISLRYQGHSTTLSSGRMCRNWQSSFVHWPSAKKWHSGIRFMSY